MAKNTAHLGTLAVELHIPASQSLKAKRRVIKSLKDRIRVKFNVSVSEVGELDKWQKSVFGVAMVSNDRDQVSRAFEAILNLMETHGEVRIVGHRIEFI